MKIRSINFNSDGEPESLLVEMSDREAALIYAFTGFTPTKFAMDAGDGTEWGSVMDEVADSLRSRFFNLMWDDGWNEVGPRRLGQAVTNATRESLKEKKIG